MIDDELIRRCRELRNLKHLDRIIGHANKKVISNIGPDTMTTKESNDIAIRRLKLADERLLAVIGTLQEAKDNVPHQYMNELSDQIKLLIRLRWRIGNVAAELPKKC